jgi:hypothetical protein
MQDATVLHRDITPEPAVPGAVYDTAVDDQQVWGLLGGGLRDPTEGKQKAEEA